MNDDQTMPAPEPDVEEGQPVPPVPARRRPWVAGIAALALVLGGGVAGAAIARPGTSTTAGSQSTATSPPASQG